MCIKYKINYMETEEKQLEILVHELGTHIFQFIDGKDWNDISQYQHLSESFIREFADKVNWYYISRYQKLSEDFIRDFSDKVYWSDISCYQKLSENFIREFSHKVYWPLISKHQKLSEDFIREFKDDVNWDYISRSQKLSEDVIREFKDKVSWWWISHYQQLSEDFIREFKNKVNWEYISKYQKLSESFIREFKDRLYTGLIKYNWIYKDKDFLKQAVIDTGLYECHEDYFIAYKGIRRDRHSNFNFQYQYLPGETYESWCDCTITRNSFGLSVWTEEKAREYCDELVVKVKVNYEDVGRVVHNDGKIRVRKLTVLD